ncbi:MAG: sigma-70 family RNA polymerase sigma factor [Lachnospiraceae bacterium]|nr:sigma-70 family RNA polymerase sigma factor [Lachnospiraceae bacterium]
MQDDELINILKTDPNSGMTLLLKQYGGLVYSVVKHKLAGQTFCDADIEHCVADTFSEFYCDLDKFHEAAGSIRAWLCVIARHNAYDRLRRYKKEAGTLSLDAEGFAEPQDDTFSVEEALITKEFREALLREIKALGEPDSTILLRKYYFSESSREIAAALNLTVSSVDTRTHRAIQKLRSIFGGERV